MRIKITAKYNGDRESNYEKILTDPEEAAQREPWAASWIREAGFEKIEVVVGWGSVKIEAIKPGAFTHRYTLEALSSAPDFAGNSYHAFIFTDTETGREVKATTRGGESNISRIPYYLNGGSYEPRNYVYTVDELKIRAFNRLTKNWEYAGCNSEDIAAFILNKLGQ